MTSELHEVIRNFSEKRYNLSFGRNLAGRWHPSELFVLETFSEEPSHHVEIEIHEFECGSLGVAYAPIRQL